MTLALVYRGPASCADGCSQAWNALLKSSSQDFEVRYIGPNERLRLTAKNLATAAVYVQPGGNDEVSSDYRFMRSYKSIIRNYVHDGGRYLGSCMGGYLAGSNPGYDLLTPGDTDEYISRPQATIHTPDNTIVEVKWRGKKRYMFFQDGPVFVDLPLSATVLATYTNGDVAAAVMPFGTGKIGVVGPHPEADKSWYKAYGLTNPDGIKFDLGFDLIATTMA